MRIVSGAAHGKTLLAPKGMNTRPTTERVREAIFSVLAPYIEGAKVLDAFAGSGALGLEALSRGAAAAVFIEKDRRALDVLRKNIFACGFNQPAQVLAGDTNHVMQTLSGFDIVLLDPPYNRGLITKIEPQLLSVGFLNEGALVMLETSSKEPELFTDERWQLYKSRVYGDTAIYYYGIG